VKEHRANLSDVHWRKNSPYGGSHIRSSSEWITETKCQISEKQTPLSKFDKPEKITKDKYRKSQFFDLIKICV
jgi:hypothetical protein